MADVLVPWEAINALVAADRRFVTAVRDVAERLRVINHPSVDVQDWLVLRVPEIEWRHQQLLVAEAELRSPSPDQSLDWLLLRLHVEAGFRQVLGAGNALDWNPRISASLHTIVPVKASVLKEAVSVVSAAGVRLNLFFHENRQDRRDELLELFRSRTMYAENHYWFWQLREVSGDYSAHVWNGVRVPIDVPTRAAAIHFAGVAEGYILPISVPISLRTPDGTHTRRLIYGSLLGAPEIRRQQFTEALDQTGQERVVLGAELYVGRLPLLSEDEGIFGAWWLTDHQYAELQQLCEAHTWPKDLWIESTPWWQL
jgi:hypothetical protein